MKKTCLRFLTGRLLLFWAIMAIGMVCACTDENPAGEEGNEGNGSTEGDNTPTVSDVIVQMNRDVADMQQLAEGKVKILTCVKESSGRYQVELDNGHVLTVFFVFFTILVFSSELRSFFITQKRHKVNHSACNLETICVKYLFYYVK